MAEEAKVATGTTTVKDFLEAGRKRLSLSIVAGEGGLDRQIRETAINRPGLALAGFYRFFPVKRIQLVGHAEFSFAMSLGEELRRERMERLFATRVPCIVYTRRRKPDDAARALAERYSVPLLRTQMITGPFANAATILMEELTAPRTRIHATMMEVAGLGVLIEGVPGIGKSETALGLIKRGYALVADDCTEVRRAGDGHLVGSAVPLTRFYMEMRGLGIIHVPSIFGAASVRGEKQVDLVVTLRRQNECDDDIDRTGENVLLRQLLGVDIPQVVVPVAPGRDLVNFVETVAQEFRLRLSGQVAHLELDERIKRRHSQQATAHHHAHRPSSVPDAAANTSTER